MDISEEKRNEIILNILASNKIKLILRFIKKVRQNV